jgi:hypothetical protein
VLTQPEIEASVDVAVHSELAGKKDRVSQRWNFHNLQPGASYVLGINLDDVRL